MIVNGRLIQDKVGWGIICRAIIDCVGKEGEKWQLPVTVTSHLHTPDWLDEISPDLDAFSLEV